MQAHDAARSDMQAVAAASLHDRTEEVLPLRGRPTAIPRPSQQQSKGPGQKYGEYVGPKATRLSWNHPKWPGKGIHGGVQQHGQ